VQLAAMRRALIPEEERVAFAVYLDEFHNFTTEAFASILAEARKYRLSLVIGHQYLDQVAAPVRAAVFGNVGTLIAFGVGHTDAEELD
jgi:type IV secretory pathway TraG/TraD family ATPase VirD4